METTNLMDLMKKFVSNLEVAWQLQREGKRVNWSAVREASK